MRAFIFSLDAFVAFALAILAIYSLIFFSSIPSGYYSALLQVHTLASDTLEALSLTPCTSSTYVGCGSYGTGSLLEYVALQRGTADPAGDARAIISPHIPKSFGYKLELKTDSGGWAQLYDTRNDPLESTRPAQVSRMAVSAYSLVFNYDNLPPEPSNPNRYLSCNGPNIVCGIPHSDYILGSASTVLVKLTLYT